MRSGALADRPMRLNEHAAESRLYSSGVVMFNPRFASAGLFKVRMTSPAARSHST